MKFRTDARVFTAPAVPEGAGVIVHRAFPAGALSYHDPFLLLDEMGPMDFRPGEATGFPDHPHRGFETVTYLLAGEMQHRDSWGNHGVLRPGDVQWMTAGSGLVHSEMPGESVARNGGRLHGFQLWVNLPKTDKMKQPHYQELPGERIPIARGTGVEARVIAGTALGITGNIQTHTPILYLHVKLEPGAEFVQEVPRKQNVLAYSIPDHRATIFANDGDGVKISGPGEYLLIAGEPLGEPVARAGPFVMNTKEELYQAFTDYQTGKMGVIA